MSCPDTVTAVATTIKDGSGAATSLHPVRVPISAVRDGETLILVTAAGVNRSDIFQRVAFHPTRPRRWDGWWLARSWF